MAYLAVKEMIYIKIETSEWLLISIGLGIAIYPEIQTIIFPDQVIPWILCPVVMCVGFFFQLGYRKYRHMADPKKHNPLDVILFNKFATSLPIVFGMLIAYFGLLSLLPLEWSLVLCYCLTCFGNIRTGAILHKYLRGDQP